MFAHSHPSDEFHLQLLASTRGGRGSASILLPSVRECWSLLRYNREGKQQLHWGSLLLRQNPMGVQCFSVYNERRHEEAHTNVSKPDVSVNTSCFSICVMLPSLFLQHTCYSHRRYNTTFCKSIDYTYFVTIYNYCISSYIVNRPWKRWKCI